MTFNELGLIDPILKALEDQGYEKPTPIQSQSIPSILKGKDLLGCAQTGTGKTAAFTIPIIQNLYKKHFNRQSGKRKIRALIITPTRELAIQISDNISNYAKYTKIRNTVIFGGVKQGRQVQALQRGVDILTATPGRLLDLINQGYISLQDIEYFVLDEADHMLDMGFIHDIRKIIALVPKKRQSLFFSATMPASIVALSKKILGDPLKVTIKPKQATAERVEQMVCFVAKPDKVKLLKFLLGEKQYNSVLVFSRTKHGADKIVRLLKKVNILAAAIHGNKSQNNRQKALKAFKEGKINILIATDIAARGIDVEELELVINYDLPNVPETYVHRIGRTGRASASGLALSFCMGDERPYLKDIQKLIGQQIPVRDDHPFVDESEVVPTATKNNKGQQGRSQGGNGNRKKYKNKNRSRWGGKRRKNSNTSNSGNFTSS